MALTKVAVPRWHSVSPDSVANYHVRLREVDLSPVEYTEPGRSVRECAGLLLTGGVDVDPALYGEAPHPKTDPPQRERDELELALLREAMAARLPVFAICRGMQLLNVCLGGSLLQHIEGDTHRWDGETNESSWHDVSLTPGTQLQTLLGGERARVNSRHHQAVTPECLAPGLRIAALSDDGLVEAVEFADAALLPILAVQWHPERSEGDDAFIACSSVLFSAFAASINRA
ncbi:MAG TPA: gamma-glutamyl-gamma-aminobutyrate hydrolase family protein [Dehalococcoidia bacterium]|nr:gamma-glutamyl-gamma-aminobutyrate hydrolase family protein [Dehalococcoidia bacterium]